MARHVRPSDRDLSVIRLVADLRHVTSQHVQELLFNDVSRNRCLDVLTRLTTNGYLDRSEKRPMGGVHGGSAFYIYRLARRGHFLLTADGPYKARRVNVEHSLTIADCIVAVRRLERAGQVVHVIQTEPDCWREVGGVQLKPDLYVELEHPTVGYLPLFMEIDMATEGRKRILEKFTLYTRAYTRHEPQDVARWPKWPTTLFVAVDIERKHELEYLLREVPEDLRQLFRVTTRQELPNILTT